MFEAFGFSADLRTLQKNHLSYLRARPLWWLSSFCLNSVFFCLGHSSSIADLLLPDFLVWQWVYSYVPLSRLVFTCTVRSVMLVQ